MTGISSVFDRIIQVLFSLLGVYLFWFVVTAEQEGRPVLTVNSIEFNNEGAKYLDVLMPEIVRVMEDVAGRCGFHAIYVGISDFGQDWMDRHFEQGTSTSPITKVHSLELGFTYYFDAYAVKRNGGTHWEYLQQRGWFARSYAIVFGFLELQKGNRAKAREFFRSAWNVNNLWAVSVADAPENRLPAHSPRVFGQGEVITATPREDPIPISSHCRGLQPQSAALLA